MENVGGGGYRRENINDKGRTKVARKRKGKK